MNKYLEMMYERAESKMLVGICPFCDADSEMESWVVANFQACKPVNYPCAWATCIFCPHAEYANLPFMMDGDGEVTMDDTEEGCTMAGRRAWRKYRDFFNEESETP